MDPATARLALWRRAGSTRLRGGGLARLLAEVGGWDGAGAADKSGAAADLAAVVDGGGSEGRCGSGAVEEGAAAGDPVARAAAVLGRVRASGRGGALAGSPPDTAVLLADAVLARALGWPVLLPLLSTGFGRRDLAAEGEALRHACRLAILREAPRVAALAADLARRAARLRAVAPKLRAKVGLHEGEDLLARRKLLVTPLTSSAASIFWRA